MSLHKMMLQSSIIEVRLYCKKIYSYLKNTDDVITEGIFKKKLYDNLITAKMKIDGEAFNLQLFINKHHAYFKIYSKTAPTVPEIKNPSTDLLATSMLLCLNNLNNVTANYSFYNTIDFDSNRGLYYFKVSILSGKISEEDLYFLIIDSAKKYASLLHNENQEVSSRALKILNYRKMIVKKDNRQCYT